MFKLFKEIGRAGNATVAYPAAPLDLPDGYRGKPQHDEAACIACGACAVACPPNAISMELAADQSRITWAINYGRCIFCGRCEEVCPTVAIKLSKEFELAVGCKADLEESCSYPVATCARCGKPYASAKEIDYARRVMMQAAGAGAAAAGAEGDVDAVTGATLDAEGGELEGMGAAGAGASELAAAADKISLCLECRRVDDGVTAQKRATEKGGAR